MTLLASFKRSVEQLPESVSRPLIYVPYTMRLGLTYSRALREASNLQNLEVTQWREAQFDRLRQILMWAGANVDFYRDLFKTVGLSPQDVKSWEDWDKVPLTTKADLQVTPMPQRVAPGMKGMRVNTGGTSGQPLEFLLDSKAFAREWAHMHFIWKARGYHPYHLKLTFRGKKFDASCVLKYNAIHNEYVVNANTPMKQVVQSILELSKTRAVRWIHGYPSLVAEFASVLEKELGSSQLHTFRSGLFGVLLGSEYPAPAYRDAIEAVLSTNTVSWYGHSEMAVLARETAKGVYQSLPTYGFAEALPTEEKGIYRLVCTSFYNRAHPFIRYDTGDLISVVENDGFGLSFKVAEGRVGDFITDRAGHRHSLTAIIFGRHHEAFNHLQHLQVRQDSEGAVSLLVVPKDAQTSIEIIRSGLDLYDLDLDLRIEVMPEPIRTSSGKIRLKVT